MEMSSETKKFALLKPVLFGIQRFNSYFVFTRYKIAFLYKILYKFTHTLLGTNQVCQPKNSKLFETRVTQNNDDYIFNVLILRQLIILQLERYFLLTSGSTLEVLHGLRPCCTLLYTITVIVYIVITLQCIQVMCFHTRGRAVMTLTVITTVPAEQEASVSC